MNDPNTLETALDYARRGWAVFPIWPVASDGSCTCGDLTCKDTGKHPIGSLTPSGCKDATTDKDQIGEWWETYPEANIGIATGAISGNFILDVDAGGVETLQALEEQHGELPNTPAAITGSGGYHVFFKHPGKRVANSVKKLGAGLDVRGDGGYVVAAPSLHKSGKRYAWHPDLNLNSTEIADAPDWLLHEVTATTKTEPNRTSASWSPPETDQISEEEARTRLLESRNDEHRHATERMQRGESLFEAGDHHASVFAFISFVRWTLPEISDDTILRLLKRSIDAMCCEKHGIDYAHECLRKANDSFSTSDKAFNQRAKKIFTPFLEKRKRTPSADQAHKILTTIPAVDQRTECAERLARHFFRKYRGPKSVAMDTVAIWNQMLCSPPLSLDELYVVFERAATRNAEATNG